MGLGGIGIWQLVIILIIVMMLFGTKRLRGLGSDLGAAIKGFRSSVSGEEEVDKDAEGTDGESVVAEGDAADSVQLKKEQESNS